MQYLGTVLPYMKRARLDQGECGGRYRRETLPPPRIRRCFPSSHRLSFSPESSASSIFPPSAIVTRIPEYVCNWGAHELARTSESDTQSRCCHADPHRDLVMGTVGARRHFGIVSAYNCVSPDEKEGRKKLYQYNQMTLCALLTTSIK